MIALLLMIAAQSDPWIGDDKLLHLGATAAISASGYAIGSELGGAAPRLILGASLGLAAAGAKELADLAGLGDPSAKDFVWSAAGVAVGLAIAYLIDALLDVPPPPLFVRLGNAAAASHCSPPLCS